MKKINKETKETFEKTDKGEDIIECDNIEAMFEKLDIQRYKTTEVYQSPKLIMWGSVPTISASCWVAPK